MWLPISGRSFLLALLLACGMYGLCAENEPALAVPLAENKAAQQRLTAITAEIAVVQAKLAAVEAQEKAAQDAHRSSTENFKHGLANRQQVLQAGAHLAEVEAQKTELKASLHRLEAKLYNLQQELQDSAQEPDWKAKLRAKLQRKVSFEFVDTPFADALQFLQNLCQANVIVDPAFVATGLNDSRINLRIRDMPLELVLKWTCKMADAEYAFKNEAIFISASAASTSSAALPKVVSIEQACLPLQPDKKKGAPGNPPGGLIACRLPQGWPAGLTFDKLQALLAVAAPKARLAWDADLKFLLVAADETGEFSRATMLLRELGVPQCQPDKTISP